MHNHPHPLMATFWFEETKPKQYYAKDADTVKWNKFVNGLQNNSRFCRLKKWQLDTTTKHGRLYCLFAIPARYLDSIPLINIRIKA